MDILCGFLAINTRAADPGGDVPDPTIEKDPGPILKNNPDPDPTLNSTLAIKIVDKSQYILVLVPYFNFGE